MTRLVWPNGTTGEPTRSDGYGPRPSIETKSGATRPFHVGTDHHSIGRVCSIGAGTVIESGWIDWAGYQILIYLGEIGGVRTWVRMCHFRGHPPLSRGDRVELGQFVGMEGSTGQSTADHLHWEIYRGRVDRGSWGDPGATVDPRAFVKAHLDTSSEWVEEEDEMNVQVLQRVDGKDWSRVHPDIGADLEAGKTRKSRLDTRVTVYRGFEATGDASVAAAWGRTHCRAYKSAATVLDRAAYEGAQREATRLSLEIGVDAHGSKG